MDDQLQDTSSTESTPESVQEEQNSRQENFAALRKKLEAEEEARRAAERRLQELERGVSKNQSQPGVSHTDDDDLGADPDDFLQVKQYKKTASKFSNKLSEADKRIQELNDKLAYVEAKSELASIKDFNDVVTKESMENLARLYPDDYETMMANPNLKAKSKTAYNMIKNYGLYDSSIKESESKILKNKSKPQSPGSTASQTAQTPLARLNDYDRRVMTEEDRNRILKRLEEIKRGR